MSLDANMMTSIKTISYANEDKGKHVKLYESSDSKDYLKIIKSISSHRCCKPLRTAFIYVLLIYI